MIVVEINMNVNLHQPPQTPPHSVTLFVTIFNHIGQLSLTFKQSLLNNLRGLSYSILDNVSDHHGQLY